ncbi:hypothetical protein KC19_3G221900 [Ceratodon purpureus]|uniref:Uncharacterized protein n=1 Tax=Ceratodon purpureus TaxID=3225 RepID=A0A8T0INN3_CERPU|nr:hypothetical protein KC19_3G221900 [Ceratodon purpureus]
MKRTACGSAMAGSMKGEGEHARAHNLTIDIDLRNSYSCRAPTSLRAAMKLLELVLVFFRWTCARLESLRLITGSLIRSC